MPSAINQTGNALNTGIAINTPTPPMVSSRCSHLALGIRCLRLSLHIAIGLAKVIVLLPHYGRDRRNKSISTWSTQLMRILGMSVRTFGQTNNSETAELIVSNHISWLDVFALKTEKPMQFVAKSEIRNWPIIGRLCQGTGTLFIRRSHKVDTARINQQMSRLLQEGESVAFFPEGTSSDGKSVRPFKSSLLQSAIDCEAPIQPVYLRYVNAAGQSTSLAAYCDNISFAESLWRLLCSKDISIEMYFLPRIQTSSCDDRRQLNQAIESHIRQALENVSFAY